MKTEQIERIRELRKKGMYVLSFLRRKQVHVNLQILYSCNFRCSICDFWRDDRAHEPPMSLEAIQTVARKLSYLGPQIISIGGGEPMLHHDLVRIVEVLSRDHFPVMITNGWYMTPALARALFSAGMYEVSVSIDYADAGKHDRQRGREGAFDRAVNALRILQENRVKPFQRVHLISVVMGDNVNEIENLILLARDLGVTYVVTLYSSKRGDQPFGSAHTGLSHHLLSLKEKYPEFVSLQGYLAKFTQANAEGGIAPCYGGANLMNIDSQGNVSACIDRLENPAGNILTDDIWDIRTTLLARQRASTCARCWTSCRGSIETMMYGKPRMMNLRDYYRLTRAVPLMDGRSQ
jgi:radical SAM protein with 4Fe4S-binding SPASM domain